MEKNTYNIIRKVYMYTVVLGWVQFIDANMCVYVAGIRLISFGRALFLTFLVNIKPRNQTVQ